MKWGYISAKSSKSSERSLYLCPFLCKPRPPGVSLESLWLENIPQVPANRAKVGQNHDARKAVSATLSLLKWSGAIFRPRTSKWAFKKFCCVHFTSGVSLDSAALENIPLFAGNPAEVSQNHDARNAVSATLSVLKWSGALFRPRSSKVSVQKVLLCPFYVGGQFRLRGTGKYPPNPEKSSPSWTNLPCA